MSQDVHVDSVAKSVDYFGIIKESTAMRLFKFVKLKMDEKNGEEITEEAFKEWDSEHL